MTGGEENRGWFARNWVWLLPVGCLGMIVLAVLLVGGIFFAVTAAIRTSDVYRTALERARQNPEVVAALGEPIEVGWLVSGNISVNGPEGEANLSLPLHGPRGSATLYLVANKVAGEWVYERLEVAVDGTDVRIDLREGAGTVSLPIEGEVAPLTSAL